MAQPEFTLVRNEKELPAWITRDKIIEYFHETMKPYEDRPEDVGRALDYAFSPERGGFLMLCRTDGKWAGQLLMLDTGMGGYIPEHILLFVTVNPELRGQGVGRALIEHCIGICPGDVKLHVEYENPAKRLYERIGFTSDYAEMRYAK